ncbi:MAG: hypothetical protein JOZ19_03855 [Rubrobacter sp.]|nr:hypothetical protein [Rubrobacter sp.]
MDSRYQTLKHTDVLSERFGLGQAFGGIILLTIATNLPEITITVSTSLSQNLGVATGNILGGSPSRPSYWWFSTCSGYEEGSR